MGHGPHVACHDFLCGPQKPQKITLLSSLSVVVIYKKSYHNQCQKFKITFFKKKKDILDID